MAPGRRQYYANKVHCIFAMGPSLDDEEALEYLDGLQWPNLKSLELEVDIQEHGLPLMSMLHDGLEHIELSGYQSGGSKYFTEIILGIIFVR